ncbi:MAG: hypothetical protein PF445_06940, partial [Melioribacteraceae bacterium]|nr:hypothetical protein [Melioribacteraceae bacterium]
MKILKSILLLLILAGISILAEMLIENSVQEKIYQTAASSMRQNNTVRTLYNFDIEYVANNNSFDVKEIIKWRNIGNSLVDTFYFNLPRSLKENSDDLSYLRYKINSFTIDGTPVKLNFVNNFGKNFLDSTLDLVQLEREIESN